MPLNCLAYFRRRNILSKNFSAEKTLTKPLPILTKLKHG